MTRAVAATPRADERVERLIALLEGRELDALLVSEPHNLRYMTGFTGSSGLALVGGDVRCFITDFRYVEQAAAQVPGFEHAQGSTDLLQAIAPVLPARRPLRLGFDDGHLSVRDHGRLRAELPDDVALVAGGGAVEELRAVKDAGEIAAVEAASALAEDAFRATTERGLIGRSERAIALELEQQMRVRGADGPSFPSIVAAGAHGALPHATPRERAIERGVLVTIDFGAQLDGYCSDCTRTLAAGPVDDQARDVYELVLRAQLAALDALRAGLSGEQADAVARDLIVAAGHGEHFGHGLGHGVGLEVHERPRLARTSSASLQSGNVVTVEPGVYLTGQLGVRIEDLVVITDDGHRNVSTLPKQLLSVD